MSKIILIPHPENKNIHYNMTHLVKIVKENTSIFIFHFVNGDSIRVYDIDVINKVRDNSDIRF